MAQVILKKNFFVGYRIRKSPNHHTPVYVPDEFLDSLPEGSEVVSEGDRTEQPVEDLNGYILRDFDEVRVSEQISQEHIKDVESVYMTTPARKIIEEKNLDPKDIEGTGKNGRITAADVNVYLDSLK